MADKKPTKKVKETDKGIKVTLVPSDELIPNRLYSNHVQVTHSPYDFSLRFCDAAPIYDIGKLAENKGVFPVPVVAEIIIPFEMMPNLIEVLKNQYEKHRNFVKGAASGKKAE